MAKLLALPEWEIQFLSNTVSNEKNTRLLFIIPKFLTEVFLRRGKLPHIFYDFHPSMTRTTFYRRTNAQRPIFHF
jgi:hypothetical protein